jgi:lipoprotein signal peptidase
LGLIDVSTTPELVLMVLGLIAAGCWTLTRALTGRGRVATASFLVGGAAANLTDRILFGSVRDFLATPWLVFNLADLSLLVGVILLYFDLLAGRQRASRAEH